MADDPSVYDPYRSANGDDDTVYRVVGGGGGTFLHPALSELSGAILVLGGLYVLWRRH